MQVWGVTTVTRRGRIKPYGDPDGSHWGVGRVRAHVFHLGGGWVFVVFVWWRPRIRGAQQRRVAAGAEYHLPDYTEPEPWNVFVVADGEKCLRKTDRPVKAGGPETPR